MSTEAKPRVNQIALARFERWALPRMAARLPGWVTPDTLTVIGLLGAVLVAASYGLTRYGLGWLHLASLGYVIHWWGDSLDGTLARVRRIQRERYGFFVDHQSDAISAVLFFGGLGASPLMRLDVALALLVGYYLMMILVDHVTIARGVFKISFAGLGPTEGRLLLITAGTVVWALGNPTFVVAGTPLTLFDVMGLVGAAALGGFYVVNGLIERHRMALLDPPRPAQPEASPVPEAVLEDAGGRGT